MYKEIARNKRKTAILLAIFFAVIVALGYWASEYASAGPLIVVIAVVAATAMSLFSYYQGDKIALAVARARRIEKADNPYVYNMVENLCIASGMPMPKVHIIDDPSMNAFATGRDPHHSSIAITTGLINALENEELEGVIAHELSHIKNFDIRLGTVVIICVGIVTLIADMALRSAFLHGGRGRSSSKGNIEGLVLVFGLVLAILAPFFVQLIHLAISRKREFLADASGALITRYPEGLAGALEKIGANKTPLRSANRATAHLYFANPFKKDLFGEKIAHLFSTHPPIAERIKRLRNIHD